MKRMALMIMVGLPIILRAAISVGTVVGPGKWCGDFAAARSYAENNGRPLVLIWGSTDCSHCAALSDALSTPAGASWVAAQSAVFCLVHDTATTDATNAKAFAKGTGTVALSEFPFVCFYWAAQSKTTRFTGRIGRMPSTSGADLLAQFSESYNQFVGGGTSGGGSTDALEVSFPFGETANDRLEVPAGRTTVNVPVKRSFVGTPVKTLYLYNGASAVTRIEWEDNELMAVLSLKVPYNLSAGKTFDVTIQDEDDNVYARRSVRVVGTVENSAKNPYWIGEKTTSTLTWGEWSMDIDVVTNKVRAFNAGKPARKAYAMMLVEGSCWCPDCAMAEKNFFDKAAFKQWAVANQVVFGVLDIPNLKNGQAVPSLLRYETYETSDAFVTLRNTASADETARCQSGAGYLSRHDVAYSDALAVARRNAELVGNHTTSNGWNNVMGALRTGVPVLLLLRDDGTVAGRWNYFSALGPSAFEEGYLRRFEELMTQVDDPNEETDDSVLTTTREIIAAEPAVEATVSTVDQADIYRVVGVEPDDEAEFTVTGDAALAISILDESGSVLTNESGLASEGLTLKMKVGDAAYFLKVEPQTIRDGTFFGYANSASTVCAYSVSLTAGRNGGLFGFTLSKTNVLERCGTVALSVRRESGSSGAAEVSVVLAEPNAAPGGIGLPSAPLSWADGEDGVKTAYLTVGELAEDVVLTFALSGLTVDAKDYGFTRDRMAVKAYDTDYAGEPVYRDVAVEKSIDVEGYQAGDVVQIELQDGALPDGVVLEADGGQVRVHGVPVASGGDYSAGYRITLKRGGVAVGTQDVTLDFSVVDYDFAADIPSLETCRHYRNLPVIVDDRVKGLLQLTVPYDGTLSARYMAGGQAFAYVADGWTSFDTASGRLAGCLVAVDDSQKTMAVWLDVKGGEVAFEDPLTGEARQISIDSDAFPAGAQAWKGRYTVQMPQTVVADGRDGRLGGCATLALQMTSDDDVAQGMMLYAGVLPNGCGFCGSSVLMTNEQGFAQLPFYHVSAHRAAPFSFSGGLSIADQVTREAGLQWCVSNAWKTVWTVPDGPVHGGEFLAIGGLYDPNRTRALYESDFGTDLTDFAFVVDAGDLTSGRYGDASAMAAVPLTMSAEGVPSIVSAASNSQGVTLTFKPDTGVVTGQFVLPFERHAVSVRYHGIVLPGWQSCADCSEKHFVQRPWAAGSCSFSDRTVGLGIYRNGCAIRLGQYK